MKLVYGILLLVAYAASEECILGNLKVVRGAHMCRTTRQPLGKGAYVEECGLFFVCSLKGIAACHSSNSVDDCVTITDECKMLEKPEGGTQFSCKTALE